MAFNVRIHSYSGVVAAQQFVVKQISNDSVFLLREPYISGQTLASDGTTEVVSQPMPPGTRLARVEVDDGNTILFEVRRSGVGRTATVSSPNLSGRDLVFLSEGSILAFMDASSTPSSDDAALLVDGSEALLVDGVDPALLVT
jgi:hypothetical protein